MEWIIIGLIAIALLFCVWQIIKLLITIIVFVGICIYYFLSWLWGLITERDDELGEIK